MLMIRFQRIGRRNDPAFRIAVLEKTAGPKAGKYVDLVGTYNPKTKAVTLKPEAIKDWMRKGAQVSPSLHNLLVKEGVLEGDKKGVISKKNMEKNKPAETAPTAEAPAEEAAPAEAAPTAEEAAPAPADAPAADEVVVAAPAELQDEAEAAEPAEEDEEVAEETPSHAAAADQTGEDKAA